MSNLLNTKNLTGGGGYFEETSLVEFRALPHHFDAGNRGSPLCC